MSLSSSASSKPIILHIGDPVKWNTELHEELSKHYTFVRPSTEERQRKNFIQGLKEKRWGNFCAIFRPFWNTGGEMGNWDKEMVPLIPSSCKVFASAGAGFDWADTVLLAGQGRTDFTDSWISLTLCNRHCILQQVNLAVQTLLTNLTFPQCSCIIRVRR